MTCSPVELKVTANVANISCSSAVQCWSREKPAERHGPGLEVGPDPGSVGHIKAPHHVTSAPTETSQTLRT